MNSEEARWYLNARRLHGEDANDPRMAEALEQTRRDPELLAWYENQRALDAAIFKKLREVPVPSDLAVRILAGKRAASHRSTRRAMMPLALAAAVVLLFSLGFLMFERFRPAPGEFAAMRADMAGFLEEFPKLDLATDQWPEIVQWLSRDPLLTNVELPPGLKRFPGLGCREVKWRDKNLRLVCFVARGEIVHLFVIPKRELGDAPLPSTPAYARVSGWSTASWTRSEVAYLVLTKGDKAFLSRLLTGAG